ncbi:hypothetical protein TEA_016524 [Camellia sinensis var. sinensis]|uniref:Uncharacterized protein n=1 Tax=Camellia sinensis var. sinensis TaxID=542762 RepID=A0A4S4EMR2_CAMSN|nr:hypothetical protein TEA_016524 [Camellia sinensis var. sinensis]
MGVLIAKDALRSNGLRELLLNAPTVLAVVLDNDKARDFRSSFFSSLDFPFPFLFSDVDCNACVLCLTVERILEYWPSVENMCLLLEHAMAYKGSVESHSNASKALITIGTYFQELVENVATCLIKIAEGARHTFDMLDELCKHGLIHQATHLIDLNCRTILCQLVYTGLIGLLVTLASGSIVAVRTLFELNIRSILKDILSIYDLSHKMPSPNMVDGHCNQVLFLLL